MSEATKPSFSLGGPRWAQRTLWSILWVIVGVLGITTLNGYASSGFTRVPNAFMQIFGSMISPLPKAPAGFKAVTPALLSQDFSTNKDEYLGQNVSIYGRVIPWEESGADKRINGSEDVHIQGIKSRSGTFVLALYADPEEHPDMASARPVTITVRVTDQWRAQHPGIQGQWVQVLGAVVAYNPGSGEGVPEIQSTEVRVIQEPYDIYDHNIPMQKPGSED